MSSKTLGLHLKLKNNLSDLIQEALNFKINTFQFFLTKEKSDKYIKIENNDLKYFLNQSKNFNEIFLHGSYWINLASGKKIGYNSSKKLLKKEIDLAKKLNIKNLVLHPGTASTFKSIAQDPKAKLRGIDNLVNALNSILKKENNIRILLENTAHGNRTIGSNLNDFIIIRDKLFYPEKVKFCIDLAHAFSFGYEIQNTQTFFEILNRTIGLENIKLIHLNDSSEKQGSKIDKHTSPGKGLIGELGLKNFIKNQFFEKIPIILEIPNLNKNTIFLTIEKVYSWM